MLPNRTILSAMAIVLMTISTCKSNLIYNLLRNNLAGPDLNFQAVAYPFDPNTGIRNSIGYQAANGRYGLAAIEKVGLGEDGREEERRAQQQYRDSIGALDYMIRAIDRTRGLR